MTALHSAIYEGYLRHRRHAPRQNRFCYPICMVYLDLAELDQVFNRSPWWRRGRPAWARFHRPDYLGPATRSLDGAVRDAVAEELGQRPQGPIRMLTHLRYLGHCFNPVTFYYCFDAAGEQVECVVAEITNTPWYERHRYILPRANPQAPLRWDFAKEFHVSPFNGMEQDYAWSLSTPGPRLQVHMVNREQGQLIFDATLALRRQPIAAASQQRMLLRYPWQTLFVVARIHAQALKLWWKKVPFHTHPRKISGALSGSGVSP